MTDTFSPPMEPDQGASKDYTFKTLKAEFGGGYAQRAVDGPNATRLSLSLTWSSLTPTQASEIEDFILDKQGVESFYYTPPRDSTALKFICDTDKGNFKRAYSNVGTDTITLTLTQVFDP